MNAQTLYPLSDVPVTRREIGRDAKRDEQRFLRSPNANNKLSANAPTEFAPRNEKLQLDVAGSDLGVVSSGFAG